MFQHNYSTRDPWWIVAIGGSRNWTDPEPIRIVLDTLYKWHGKDLLVMTGGYHRGADVITKNLCQQAGAPYAEVPAWWAALGQAAGPKRNRWVLRFKPSIVHLFIVDLKRSIGSMDMKQAAENLGIGVVINRPSKEELWLRKSEKWLRRKNGRTLLILLRLGKLWQKTEGSVHDLRPKRGSHKAA